MCVIVIQMFAFCIAATVVVCSHVSVVALPLAHERCMYASVPFFNLVLKPHSRISTPARSLTTVSVRCFCVCCVLSAGEEGKSAVRGL